MALLGHSHSPPRASAVWAALHRYTYINLGALMDLTRELKQVYIDTAQATGFTPGPEHFGYQLRVLVADTDAQAQAIGRGFLWNAHHRMRGPSAHNDPPGYQSRVASALSQRRAGGPDDLRGPARGRRHCRR